MLPSARLEALARRGSHDQRASEGRVESDSGDRDKATLRSIKAYNGNGLLPITINYSTIFGHDPANCAWVMKATKTGFVPVSSQPFCGHDVAGTTTLSGS